MLTFDFDLSVEEKLREAVFEPVQHLLYGSSDSYPSAYWHLSLMREGTPWLIGETCVYQTVHDPGVELINYRLPREPSRAYPSRMVGNLEDIVDEDDWRDCLRWWTRRLNYLSRQKKKRGR